MQTKIIIEYHDKVSNQVSTNAEGVDFALSKFLNILISDALSIFMNERKDSGHETQEVLIKVSGYTVTVIQAKDL